MCGPKVPVVPGHRAAKRANCSPISPWEDDTPLYLVEHDLAGSTWKQVVAVHEEITRMCAQQQADGISVHRVRSIFLHGTLSTDLDAARAARDTAVLALGGRSIYPTLPNEAD